MLFHPVGGMGILPVSIPGGQDAHPTHINSAPQQCPSLAIAWPKGQTRSHSYSSDSSSPHSSHFCLKEPNP
ncbi:hypothetical protein [Moorena sp. SIO3H5]|uniref:hypothetical protein n=1 Tax=Moorena sp. SIO3H5 TaxID=2607834 RepID=UPI0013BA4B59|nr:hypothetical protein [Moorena sp. SIO3H5]NEO70189.1 hypothetical protein [Moorena sp. SIO3H5]